MPVACAAMQDRKSTRLNSSHGYISYAVFCLKKILQFSAGPVAVAPTGSVYRLTSEVPVRHCLVRSHFPLRLVREHLGEEPYFFFFFKHRAPPESSPLPPPAALRI